MAQLNINVTDVPQQEGADPVPAGWYNVRITESEVKPTKTIGGFLLALKYAILDGQFAGRPLFSRHNIVNSNPKAQEIAYGELSAIGHAVGVLMIQDSQQLHDKPMKVKVVLKPADGQYEASNDVKLWKNINAVVGGAEVAAGSAGFPAPAGFAAPQPPAATPWAPQAAAPAPVAAAWQPPPVAAAPVYAAPPQAQAPQQPWAPPAGGQPWAPAPQAQAPQPPVAAAPIQYAPPAAPQAAPAAAPPPWSAPAPAGAIAPPWATAPAQ